MEILVRGPNWTGDLVMSTPGFRSLRAGFPDARITLQLRGGLIPLMAGAPWFDQVIPLSSYAAGAMGLVREAMSLRRRGRFDIGLCIPDSFSSALLMRLAGVRQVVGYRRGGRGLLLHHPVSPAPDWGRDRLVARELFVLGLTESLDCQERGTHLELFTTPEEESRAKEVFERHNLDPEGPLVALAPGASFGPSKRWPTESFAKLGDAAVRTGARVILVGAPDERSLAREIAGAMRERAVNLIGELDLGVAKAVLRRVSVLVCNDAGARHIAVAFAVPCVMFVGPTSLRKTHLNLAGVKVLETAAECRPCYLRTCPIDHRCMTGLTTQAAIDATLETLGERAASAP